MPPSKPPSHIPRKNLAATRPPKDFVKPENVLSEVSRFVSTEMDDLPDQTPTDKQKGQVVACFEVFDNPVRRHVYQDIWDVEHDKGDIEFVSREV
jgi:hypothetical protein